jgi:ABC-type branched-subunit amino acid transport system ATPase component
MSILTVRELRASYGRAICALRDVSLDVPAGAVVAVLGSNGAGKTTLLRAISGVLPEHGGTGHGEITFEGQSLTGRSAAAIVASGIVQAPEGRRIFERLTVGENLRIGAFGVRNANARRRARQFVCDLFPILHDRREARAGLLSGGQQQMLAIGRALMAQPRLLLLDEPSLGLAPRVVGQIGRVISQINAAGTTVLLVEQNASMALSVAAHAFVLTNGEVSLSGPAGVLAADDTVRDLYLGRDNRPELARELATIPRAELRRWVG